MRRLFVLLVLTACNLDSVEPLEPSRVDTALPVGEAHRRESLLLKMCRGKPLTRKLCEEKTAKKNGW